MQALNKDIGEIDAHLDEGLEPLTTVIGIKCIDGIVIASDSQATSKLQRTKTLGVSKIFKLNDFSLLGGSGDGGHIKILVGDFKERLSRGKFNKKKFRDIVEQAFLDLHKRHNTVRAKLLGLKGPQSLFHPSGILGAKFGANNFDLYLLRQDGWLIDVDDYEVIGSGKDLAEFVIKVLNRSTSIIGKTISNVKVEDVVRLACYIIKEVKESDSQSGGLAKVAVIDDSGVRELSENEVRENYETFVNVLAYGYSQLITDKPIEELENITKK
jgi:20S proteasome alpha/beta subunit